MRVPLVLAIAGICSAPLLTSLRAQDVAEPQPLNPEITAVQKAFSNLPEEQRTEFLQHLGEASRLFQQKRVIECMDSLAKAEKIFDQAPEVYNLKGSCFVEIRAFDKAMVAFERAVELSGGDPSVKFNIAEVHFVTKEWQKALELFQEIITGLPEGDQSLSRLVEFKILLCQKKLGMDAEAEKLAAKYGFEDDSPFYYYSQAALAYENGETIEAERWLSRAATIFQNPAQISPWQDTLVEYGYIKSFYGDDSAAE